MASSPEENLKEMKQRRRKATNFDRNSSSTCIEKIPEKKNGKYIRNKNKKNFCRTHRERQPSRFTIFFFQTKKKRSLRPWIDSVYIQSLERNVFLKKMMLSLFLN